MPTLDNEPELPDQGTVNRHHVDMVMPYAKNGWITYRSGAIWQKSIPSTELEAR